MESIKIALLGDMHYFTPQYSRKEKLIQDEIDVFYQEYLNMVKASFPVTSAISVGDLTHRGTRNEFNRIYELIRKSGLSLSHVMGNHDLFCHTRDELNDLEFYKRDTADQSCVGSFVYVDTPLEKCEENWGGKLNDYQLELIAAQREKASSTPVITVAHHPVYNTTEGSTEYLMSIDPNTDMNKLLCPSVRPSVFVCGHVHLFSCVKTNGWWYIQIPSIFAGRHIFALEFCENRLWLLAEPIKDQKWIERAELFGCNLIGHTYFEDKDIILPLNNPII